MRCKRDGLRRSGADKAAVVNREKERRRRKREQTNPRIILKLDLIAHTGNDGGGIVHQPAFSDLDAVDRAGSKHACSGRGQEQQGRPHNVVGGMNE